MPDFYTSVPVKASSFLLARNIVAAWGWFGVNLMGIGLHSYGFVEGGWFWFFLFVGLQVLAAASALIPQRSR